jgi:hypothetical protein
MSGDLNSDQDEFAPIQEFPLDFLSWFLTDGCGERDREVNSELGVSAFPPMRA